MARNAASSTTAGAPAKVSTVRLWSRSEERSSRRAPSTEVMAATIWSMISGRRASEKFGIHSINVVIWSRCPWSDDRDFGFTILDWRLVRAIIREES